MFQDSHKKHTKSNISDETRKYQIPTHLCLCFQIELLDNEVVDIRTAILWLCGAGPKKKDNNVGLFSKNQSRNSNGFVVPRKFDLEPCFLVRLIQRDTTMAKSLYHAGSGVAITYITPTATPFTEFVYGLLSLVPAHRINLQMRRC